MVRERPGSGYPPDSPGRLGGGFQELGIWYNRSRGSHITDSPVGGHQVASSLTVAVERLWGEDTNAKGYPREVIAQVLAMAELGYSATDISREFRGNPSVDTVRKWIQQARLLGLNPSPDE